jgi:hypothetical protein
MGCACGGSNADDIAEFEVRLPNGKIVTVKGKAAAEMTVQENGGGYIVKKKS